MSTDKQIMEDVIRLNNEGVWCLNAGQDSKKALLYFKEALTKMGALNHSFSSSNVRGDAKRTLTESPARPPTLISEIIPGMEDECLYIHNRAIYLHSSLFSSTVSPCDDIHDCGIASSIIIFNLGLACHYHGMRYHDIVKLRKACELYHLCAAWTAQEEEAEAGAQRHSYQNRISVALTLASVNNHGMILHRLLGEQERAHELMNEHLLVSTSTVDFAPSNLLDQEHFDEILLNILTVTSGMAVVVSAAA